ncbi:MAG TPA: hypothetical protein VF522_19130 [Ramlibacter sp.]|uniref:hypothetical protein n=1 Tax=Ramlibacter sp. TaxID=1917967 RepID=UPI002ED4A562
MNFQFANPADAILGGVKMGAGLREMEQAQALKQQQLIAAQQQQQALQGLAMNPNAGHADYARVMTMYPALAEELGKAFKVQEEGQRQTAVNFGSRVYAAQLAGNSQLAAELLRERAKADPGQAQHYSTMADLIEKSPATAKTISALGLAAAMGPDKFAEAFTKIGGEQRAEELQGGLVRKGNADASTAESTAVIKAEEAKAAPQSVLLDLQKKGWDIKKIQEDIEIAKQSNRIAAMNAQTSRINSDTQRQELKLKIQEAETKLADKVREKVATAEAGATNIDNMLNTIERIKVNPRLNDVLGAFEGRMPAITSDDSADAIALIDTLGSQAFLAQIPNIKGMGALSNAEGEKLQAALQNLSRKQSEGQFRKNLDEASRLLKKGRENITRATGVPLGKPDTPAAPGSRPPLSSFQKP